MDTAELADWLSRHSGYHRYWIGYSGGLDSHVLLHLCARLQQNGRFAAVHVHHGLQPQAESWAESCAEICAKLGLPFQLLRVNAKPQPGASPEEVARNARYAAFAELLGDNNEALLTAQHADDQAETLLLQLLRGAGLAGLAGMPDSMPLGRGKLLRPLLAWSRSDIQAYAKNHGLHWIEDPSNQDISFDRNFVRHQVMPLLVSRWPSAGSTLARSAQHCAEAQQQLNRLADDLLLAADRDNRLSVAQLCQWQAPEQRLVLRHWLKNLGFRAPSTAVLQRIIAEVLLAAADRNPRVAWREGEVRRYRDNLYALHPLPAIDSKAVYAWDGRQPLVLPGNGVLHTDVAVGRGIHAECLNGALEIRYRQGGERCRIAGRAGGHTLKKLFQEAQQVPPWARQRVPLLYIDDQLAAVGDLWVCQPFAGGDIRLCWNEHGL